MDFGKAPLSFGVTRSVCPRGKGSREAAMSSGETPIVRGETATRLAATARIWRSCYGTPAEPPFTRVSVAIQFTSQVLPPSSEKDCS